MQKLTFCAVILTIVTFQSSYSAPWRSETCQRTVDIAFLVDTSSSISVSVFNRHVKEFLNNVVSTFQVGPGEEDTRVSLALFSTRVYVQFYLYMHKTLDDVQAAINRTRYRGGDTYTHYALETAGRVLLSPSYGARHNVTKIVVVLTDGKSVDSRKTLEEAEKLKARGVEIFAIGVGNGVDYNELESMASTPASQFSFRVSDFQALKSIQSKFSSSTCQTSTTPAPTTTTTTPTTTTTTPTTTTTTPIPTTTSTTTTPTTTTTQTTTTTTPTTTTTTPTPTTTSTTTTPTTTTTQTTTITTPTTTTTTPTTTTTSTTPKPTTRKPVETTEELPSGDTTLVERCRGKPADIYFLLDASTSVWIVHFHDRVLPFVRDLVSSFHISPLHTRVGLVSFSTGVEHVFDLSEHETLNSLLGAIQPDNVDYLTGTTNTGDAIRFVTEKAFVSGEARRDVAHIIITITDGWSQKPQATAAAAAEARRRGIYIFAVGVGQEVDQQELMDIASDPDDDYVFSVDNFKALNTITDLLALKACKAVVEQSDRTTVVDKPECTKTPTNVVFAYEYTSSIEATRIINQHVIGKFTYDVMKYAPYVKVGQVTQPCIGGSISLMETGTFSKVFSEMKERLHISFPELIVQMRQETFEAVPLVENRVAVLIVDENTQFSERFLKEVRAMKFKNVKVIVLAVGDVEMHVVNQLATTPASEHVIYVDSYYEMVDKNLDLLYTVCDSKSLAKHISQMEEKEIVVTGYVKKTSTGDKKSGDSEQTKPTPKPPRTTTEFRIPLRPAV